MVGERVARRVAEQAAAGEVGLAVTVDRGARLERDALARHREDLGGQLRIGEDGGRRRAGEAGALEHDASEGADELEVVPAGRRRQAPRRGRRLASRHTRGEVGTEPRLRLGPHVAQVGAAAERRRAPAVSLRQHQRLEGPIRRALHLGEHGSQAAAHERAVTALRGAAGDREAQHRGAVVLAGADDRIREAAIVALELHPAGHGLVGDAIGARGQIRAGTRRGRSGGGSVPLRGRGRERAGRRPRERREGERDGGAAVMHPANGNPRGCGAAPPARRAARPVRADR